MKKGFKAKLVPGFTLEDKDRWITMVRETEHKLELSFKDVRKEDTFVWLDQHIKLVNEATKLLNIGKGLQQSIDTAVEIDGRFLSLESSVIPDLLPTLENVWQTMKRV